MYTNPYLSTCKYVQYLIVDAFSAHDFSTQCINCIEYNIYIIYIYTILYNIHCIHYTCSQIPSGHLSKSSGDEDPDFDESYISGQLKAFIYVCYHVLPCRNIVTMCHDNRYVTMWLCMAYVCVCSLVCLCLFLSLFNARHND